jgi:uncharacterized protein
MYKITSVIIGVIVLILIVSTLLWKNFFTSGVSPLKVAQNQQFISIPSVTTTPLLDDPFVDLTIPYLRQRNYQSSLGPLTKLNENSTYSSYLTSYTSDNLKINALLTEPKGDKPEGGWPAIVFVHGYIPPTSYKTTEKYTDYIDYLARNGFVVLKIDLRGHGSSEGEPNGAYYSADYVVDTLHAYKALQSAAFVNPKRVGLWGHSMAGNVVLRSLVSMPDIPAGVIWAGAGFTYSDLRTNGISDSSYQPLPPQNTSLSRRQQLTNLHDQANPDDPFWKQVIPTNYLSDFKGAIQLDHAVDDPVVSVEYSRGLDKILGQTQIPHELHELPSGGHNITGSSFTDAMNHTVKFYKEHL